MITVEELFAELYNNDYDADLAARSCPFGDKTHHSDDGCESCDPGNLKLRDLGAFGGGQGMLRWVGKSGGGQHMLVWLGKSSTRRGQVWNLGVD